MDAGSNLKEGFSHPNTTDGTGIFTDQLGWCQRGQWVGIYDRHGVFGIWTSGTLLSPKLYSLLGPGARSMGKNVALQSMVCFTVAHTG